MSSLSPSPRSPFWYFMSIDLNDGVDLEKLKSVFNESALSDLSKYGVSGFDWSAHKTVYTGDRGAVVEGKQLSIMSDEETEKPSFFERLLEPIGLMFGEYGSLPCHWKNHSIYLEFEWKDIDKGEGSEFESVSVRTPWRSGVANNNKVVVSILNLMYKEDLLDLSHYHAGQRIVNHPDNHTMYQAGREGGLAKDVDVRAYEVICEEKDKEPSFFMLEDWVEGLRHDVLRKNEEGYWEKRKKPFLDGLAIRRRF